jgi:RHS repeat-associated protein
MERDDEVKGKGNHLDFGNRVYDPRLGRFFSTDRIVQPYESPYSSHGNNPIAFVDVEGNDNIVYLVLLPSAQSKLSQCDLDEIVGQMMDTYRNSLGLNVEVKIFACLAEFDPQYLDNSDSYALIGDVEDLVKRQSTWGETSYRPLDGSKVLELSKRNSGLVTVNMEAVYHWSNNLNISIGGVIAWAIVHGTGHNADKSGYIYHHAHQWYEGDMAEGKANIMTDGAVLEASVNYSDYVKDNNLKKLIEGGDSPYGVTSLDKSLEGNFWKIYEKQRNKKVGETMKKDKFNAPKPQDNYDKNKAKKQNKAAGPGAAGQ